MKKFMPFLIVFVIVSIIVVLFLSLASSKHMVVIQSGNLKQLPIAMKPNKYQDSDCGMVIKDLSFASQVVAKDGKTWFFHDNGDFVDWLKDKKFKNSAKIWVMSMDTKRWIDGRKAFYSRTDTTPMGYGFGAYEKNATNLISFKQMRIKMLRGETLKNPLIRKELLSKQCKQ